MLGQSNLLLVAATCEKLGTVAPFKVADATMIDHLVVENDVVDTAWFAEVGVQVHIAAA